MYFDLPSQLSRDWPPCQAITSQGTVLAAVKAERHAGGVRMVLDLFAPVESRTFSRSQPEQWIVEVKTPAAAAAPVPEEAAPAEAEPVSEPANLEPSARELQPIALGEPEAVVMPAIPAKLKMAGPADPASLPER